jgi:hypothetical protein
VKPDLVSRRRRNLVIARTPVPGGGAQSHELGSPGSGDDGSPDRREVGQAEQETGGRT